MTQRFIEFGGWRANCRALTLTSVGQEIKVERKVMAALEELAVSAPNVVTREELLRTIWPDVVVGENALHRVVGLLRKSLGDKAKQPRYIESVAGVGYRLLLRPTIKSEDAGESEPKPNPLTSGGRPATGGVSVLVSALRIEKQHSLLADVVNHVIRYLNWSHGALRVYRLANGSEIDYRVEIHQQNTKSNVRTLWDLYSADGSELVESGYANTTSEPADPNKLADQVAEAVSRAVRQHRLHLLDGARDIDHLSYWDLIILAEHYRSMRPEHLTTRERMLRRAIAMHPREPAARAVYGDFLSWKLINGIVENAGHTKKSARAQNAKALEWGNRIPYVLAKCGTSYSRIGEYEQGCELGLSACDLAPSNYNKDLLATSFTYAGKPENAIALYFDIERSMPDGAVFQYGRLVVPLIQSGRFEEADKYSVLANTHFPRDYFCWVLRANLLEQLGRNEAAKKALKEARDLMPSLKLQRVINGIVLTYCRTPAHTERMTAGLKSLSAQFT